MACFVRRNLGARGSRWLAERRTPSFGSGGNLDQPQRGGVDSSSGDMRELHGEEDAHKGAKPGTRDGIVHSSCREREGDGRCPLDRGDDPQGGFDDEEKDGEEEEGDEVRLRSGQHAEEDDGWA